MANASELDFRGQHSVMHMPHDTYMDFPLDVLRLLLLHCGCAAHSMAHLKMVLVVKDDPKQDLCCPFDLDRHVDSDVGELYWPLPDRLLLPLGECFPSSHQEASQLQSSAEKCQYRIMQLIGQGCIMLLGCSMSRLRGSLL